MSIPASASSEAIVKCLISARQSERMEAQRRLKQKPEGVNPDLARQLILDELRGKCAPRPRQDDRHAGARCWLLSSLELVPSSGSEPDDTLYRFLDETHEWAPWPRYWALQALLHRRSPGLENACRTRVVNDSHTLPQFLAKAILADMGDQAFVEEIREVLADAADAGKRWAVLRALRFVYLPFAVEPVAEIVNQAKKNFDDVTFDAVVALGNVPGDAPEANVAANALINLITRSRQFQFWDVMRIKAIESLGRLRVGHTAALLLDELTDLNPSIVKEAVIALERMLDAETMTARMLECLAKDHDRDTTLHLYARALRYLADDKPAVNRLESAMASGPFQTREYARRLLSEMGGSYAVDKLAAQAQGAERYLEVLDDNDKKLREMFDGTLEEGRRGFHIVTMMDITLFVVGLVMLGLSIGLAVADKQLIAVLTASGGILSAVYGRFFAKPREQVVASVTHLAALKAIFQGYLRQLRQIDQTYARRMLDKDTPDAAETKQFTVLVEDVMAGALRQLSSQKEIARTGEVDEAIEQPRPKTGETAEAAKAAAAK